MTGGYPDLYLRGLSHFNRGEYYDCHDVLEALWFEGACRSDFLRGLIQAAVALHHYTGNNRRGARNLYRRSRGHLGKFLPAHMGLDVGRFLKDMEACFAEILEARAGEILEGLGSGLGTRLNVAGLDHNGDGLTDLAVGIPDAPAAYAWYSYGEDRIGQGKENVREFLRMHPEMAEEIEAKIRARLLPSTVPEVVDDEVELKEA